ncbi:MAG TPA: ester cyclase [Dehalococcoidia bacterium]|nr:ester cyclase [Dehalococcoidia bacterium]
MAGDYRKLREQVMAIARDIGSLDRDGLRGQLDQLLSPEARWDSDVFIDGAGDRAAFASLLEDVKVAFPDLALEITSTYESEREGEVAFEAVVTGTNHGFLANAGPTRRPVRLLVNGVIVFAEDQRIARLRTTWNCAYLMAQLGIRAHMRADPPRRSLSAS